MRFGKMMLCNHFILNLSGTLGLDHTFQTTIFNQ